VAWAAWAVWISKFHVQGTTKENPATAGFSLCGAGSPGEIRRVGGARHFLDRFEAKSLGILAERRDVLICVAAKVHAGLLSAGNRSIVDIGEVDHLLHAVAEEVLQRPS